MKEAIKKEILHDISKAITILQVREAKDLRELKELSDHAIEDVAVEKDLDLISITVLIYSIYKVLESLPDVDYSNIIDQLQEAADVLQRGNLGAYNKSIKQLYDIIRKSDAKVKVHFQDVMDAARIKKGTTLLEHGLSMGQAAGLMGLSNWDLQEYASKTTALDVHDEGFPAKKRLQLAFKLFGVQ